MKRKRIFGTDHSALLSSDRDTVDVNNFKIYSVNDTKHLLDFELQIFPIGYQGKRTTAVMIKACKAPYCSN